MGKYILWWEYGRLCRCVMEWWDGIRKGWYVEVEEVYFGVSFYVICMILSMVCVKELWVGDYVFCEKLGLEGLGMLEIWVSLMVCMLWSWWMLCIVFFVNFLVKMVVFRLSLFMGFFCRVMYWFFFLWWSLVKWWCWYFCYVDWIK